MSTNKKVNLSLSTSYPLGSFVKKTGVNFSIYSKNSSSVDLLLFDDVNDQKPNKIIRLDPQNNRTGFYWHIFVSGLKAGQLYGLRVSGPFGPKNGHRFDEAKVLLDPYSLCVAMPSINELNCPMKSVVADLSSYNWEGDILLRRPIAQTIIYEMHVKGFTSNPNSGVTKEKRGTYAGLIEKIPYLKDLGINTVELLPVFQFKESDGGALNNYWGYNPISFFAPHLGYSVSKDPLHCLDEFRDMVKALHKEGIEIILDVVYNHTAEGNHLGPTFCFKGLENNDYYILENDKEYYSNYSGTGNTLNSNNSIVRRMILDSLRYWVEEMHVDGFRFDLASILSRDEAGMPMANPPILLDIESDPVLAGVKLFAEAWDAAGLYQVGSFVGDSWKEWNGKFRDEVRSFVKGDLGKVYNLANRLLASPDMYSHQEREAEQSINFITCHDGFTLNDLVSYNQKHNESNLEDNRDGENNNLSWNCGIEGPTTNKDIEKLRIRQIKNFFTLNLIALGTPMILMGDEIRRTQNGNNNAYCQDNEISWFDWSLLKTNSNIFHFVKTLIKLRYRTDYVESNKIMSLNQILNLSTIKWSGTKLNQPDWSYQSLTLAFTVESLLKNYFLHGMINSYWEPLYFELPTSETEFRKCNWRRIIDTNLDSPEDISEWKDAKIVKSKSYLVQPRSIVVLLDQKK